MVWNVLGQFKTCFHLSYSHRSGTCLIGLMKSLWPMSTRLQSWGWITTSCLIFKKNLPSGSLNHSSYGLLTTGRMLCRCFEILMNLIFKNPLEVGNIKSLQWIRKLKFYKVKGSPKVIFCSLQMQDLIWGWFKTQTAIAGSYVKSHKDFWLLWGTNCDSKWHANFTCPCLGDYPV